MVGGADLAEDELAPNLFEGGPRFIGKMTFNYSWDDDYTRMILEVADDQRSVIHI